MTTDNIFSLDEAKELVDRMPAEKWKELHISTYRAFRASNYSLELDLSYDGFQYRLDLSLLADSKKDIHQIFYHSKEEFSKNYMDVIKKIDQSKKKDSKKTMDFIKQIGCSEGLIAKIEGAIK